MKKRFASLVLVILSTSLCQTFAQSVSLSKSIYQPGEQIIVNYAGFPGNSRDWISIAQVGMPEDKYLEWFYTGGNRNGTLTFGGRPYGNYEVRGYYNNEGIVRVRVPFRVGNADQNLSVKTAQPVYKPNEKIIVQYSGMPGNSRDWISIAQPGSADDKYLSWYYTDSKQSGTTEFTGLPEGSYEVRAYYNNEGVVRSRYSFTVSRTPVVNQPAGGKLCNRELSIFYAGVYGLGLAWARLGSDVIAPGTIADVQAVLGNAITGLNTIGCLDFNVNKISDYTRRLPGMSRAQAVNEIDALIKEILGSIQRSRISCSNGVSLASLYSIGIHLGASQGIANTFVCRMIPADWQQNLRNHLGLVRDGIAAYSSCIPGVSPSLVNAVDVSSPNAYIPFSTIVSIHIQVLWSVSLSSCCCSCP
ncbi:hypothetical protein GCM10023187_15790 [Nibrella viscosa]|uniref:Uncharacterized protein n=1 Tax=Nibrella viscosa TaxID=1084524 RepID=A0ABP8K6R7_9BACT